MKQLNIDTYRKVNNSFHRKMVYHVGIDCGFFVEINYMLNAMLYCLAHRIRFQLYSDDANFAPGTGWTEYFQPFCEEVHDAFHHKYNFHRLPSWKRILTACRHRKSIAPMAWKLKSIARNTYARIVSLLTYKEYVLLNQNIPTYPHSTYDIPELNIHCGYHEAYALLARMIWKLNTDTHKTGQRYRMALQLTDIQSNTPPYHEYDGIQIRGGDKCTETKLIGSKQIIDTLAPKDGTRIFVLTDDYRNIQALQDAYPQLIFLTLCQPSEAGYNHQKFCALSAKEKKESITRLLISMDILLHSRAFVGSITTGPSVFLMKQRANDPLVQAVDCPKESMPSALCLTIDARAKISQRTLQNKH